MRCARGGRLDGVFAAKHCKEPRGKQEASSTYSTHIPTVFRGRCCWEWAALAVVDALPCLQIKNFARLSVAAAFYPS